MENESTMERVRRESAEEARQTERALRPSDLKKIEALLTSILVGVLTLIVLGLSR